VAERPCTVSEITRAVRETLEGTFPALWVLGELSDYKQHSSGHRYFTLKDETAQIRCVMWRSVRLAGFLPEVGMQVMARGRVTVYERSGQYQLNVSQLLQAGVGQQQLALEELKRRLHAEGLFDSALKRPLPDYPRAIGVVTSRTGAAIRDILNVLRRRFPGVRVVLRPARVQGTGAAEDVAQGIADLNAFGEVDVLIVGRGGGAAEDLAAFNGEVVVRAVRASKIPVISAVGHEVDVTLADLAADVRSPTPSAAAELAVRDRAALRDRIADLVERGYEAVRRLLVENEDLLESYLDSYGLRRVEDTILQHMQRTDDLEKDLYAGMRQAFETRASAYGRLTGKLGTLSPLSVLSRGYSVAQRLVDGRVVVDAATLTEGERLRIRFARGEAAVTVNETKSSQSDI